MNRKHSFSILLLLVLIPLGSLVSQDFEEYRWKKRLVLVYSESTGDSLSARQLKEFENQDKELIDRKMLILHITADNARITYPRDRDVSIFNANKFIRQGTQQKRPFEVTLIGLDGGVKMRSQKPVLRQKIFDMIDSMPMRQAEMRRKKGKG